MLSLEKKPEVRYYDYAGKLSTEQFIHFMDEINKSLLYETNVDILPSDRIFMFSTCSYHTENGRFVVLAHKINMPNPDIDFKVRNSSNAFYLLRIRMYCACKIEKHLTSTTPYVTIPVVVLGRPVGQAVKTWPFHG